MYDLIVQKLAEIEKEENIIILHAVESGSRAWGFPSPDSDYDVRFLYVRKPEFYLKLEKTRDVIELPISDMLDINGWTTFLLTPYSLDSILILMSITRKYESIPILSFQIYF